jgi:tripeptide aminopeptidase
MIPGSNRSRLVRIFTELIAINSPSFQEQAIGRVLVRMLKAAGCRVRLQKYDRSFNLIATQKGLLRDVPPLLLSAHMDTIEPTTGIRFERKGGIIRSTGATVLGADNKSALAQIIEALFVLRERRIPHGDIEVVFSSAEEKGLVGAHHLDFGMIRGRHALVLDASGPVGTIVTGAPTHLVYQMTVTGKAAHAGIEPEKGISAITVAAEMIAEAPDGRIDALTTANIGVIQGGTAINVVPREVIIRGELRSHDRAALRAVRQTLYDRARAVAKQRGARVTIGEVEEYRSFRISDREPFIAFLEGLYRKLAIEPKRELTGGGSDANIFHAHGIMAVNLSNGMQQVHSRDEFIAVSDLVRGTRILLGAITTFPDFQQG